MAILEGRFREGDTVRVTVRNGELAVDRVEGSGAAQQAEAPSEEVRAGVG
jgi:predicted transcriptional regulator